jgi:phosphoribosyl-AMP cyclohydrolase
MLATVLFGVAIAGTPILAQTVTIDYDHSVNFLKFKSYTWDRVHATDPSVEGRITIAVDRDMSGRYMSEAAKNGDVTIAVVEATQDKQEYADFYAKLTNPTWQRGWGSGGFLDTAATLQDVPLDTLIMDIYNTKTHNLIWRGVVTEPMVKSEDKNDQKMDKAVNLLFEKFPPKFVKSK